MDLPFAPTPNDVALRVPDVAAARSELEAAGVEFAGEALDAGVCHMAFFHDPTETPSCCTACYAPA